MADDKSKEPEHKDLYNNAMSRAMEAISGLEEKDKIACCRLVNVFGQGIPPLRGPITNGTLILASRLPIMLWLVSAPRSKR
jgi:hypothetical protein